MTPEIIEVMNGIMAAHGYRKKADSWFLERPETILLINLQKSQWGDQYYVNLAIWLRGLADAKSIPPKEQDCHVRVRLTSLTTEAIERALDFSAGLLTMSERKRIVEECIRDVAIPFLEECGTLEWLKRQYTSGSLARAMVHKGVKALVGG